MAVEVAEKQEERPTELADRRGRHGREGLSELSGSDSMGQQVANLVSFDPQLKVSMTSEAPCVALATPSASANGTLVVGLSGIVFGLRARMCLASSLKMFGRLWVSLRTRCRCYL